MFAPVPAPALVQLATGADGIYSVQNRVLNCLGRAFTQFSLHLCLSTLTNRIYL